MKTNLIIIGPSASGKTELAIKLSKIISRDIISADSRQIYKGLDYSTGKLPIKYNCTKHNFYWNIEGVKYWGYDTVKANVKESEFNFVNFVNKVFLLNQQYQTNTPIIAGGTGLYINQLLNPSTTHIPPNYQLRNKLNGLSVEKLVEYLQSYNFDTGKLNNSEINNKQRLIRRIEKEEYKLNTKNIPKVSNKNLYYKSPNIVGINLLNYDKKIINWIDENFLHIEQEVKWLTKTYPSSHLFKGFIFNEMQNYIKGSTTKEEAKELIFYSYRQYIKRQVTYFKKYFPTTKWFDNKQEAYEHLIHLFS